MEHVCINYYVLSFIYSVMLINTLFRLIFDLILHVYVTECFLNKLFELLNC